MRVTKKSNETLDKAEAFALRILNFCEYVIEKNKTKSKIIINALIGQVVRSGTSVGANLSEAYFAQSEADFYCKVKISQKEAKETEYWLKLIYKKGYISKVEYESINEDCQQLIAILTAITKKLNQKVASK